MSTQAAAVQLQSYMQKKAISAKAGIEALKAIGRVVGKGGSGIAKAWDAALRNNVLNTAPVILGAGYGVRTGLQDRANAEEAKARNRLKSMDPALQSRANMQTWANGLTKAKAKLESLPADASPAQRQRAAKDVEFDSKGLAAAKNAIYPKMRAAIKAADSEGTLDTKDKPVPMLGHVGAGVLAGVTFQPRYLHRGIAPMFAKHKPVGNTIPKDTALTLASMLGTSALGYAGPDLYRGGQRLLSNADIAGQNMASMSSDVQDLAAPLTDLAKAVDPQTLRKTLDNVSQMGETLKDTSQTLQEGVGNIGTNLSKATEVIGSGVEQAGEAGRNVQQNVNDLQKQLQELLPSKQQLAIGGGLTLAGIVALMAWRNAQRREEQKRQAEEMGKAIGKGLRGPARKAEDEDVTKQ